MSDKQPRPFQGEEMVCGACGRHEQHVVGVESNWRAITVASRPEPEAELEYKVVYICPSELPGAGAEPEQVMAAYRAALKKAGVDLDSR